MIIKELTLENFKSIRKISLKNPNPFTVFVGPNGAGKSNIFEALEFVNLANEMGAFKPQEFFGSNEELIPRKSFDAFSKSVKFLFNIDFKEFNSHFFTNFIYGSNKKNIGGSSGHGNFNYLFDKKLLNEFADDKHGNVKALKPEFANDYLQFYQRFSRIFINNEKLVKQKTVSDQKLNLDASNLEAVLKRILFDNNNKEEITEWLQLLVPGLENIEIKSEPLSGTESILIYEKGTSRPFNKRLISDGTYNILSILTAVFQSDEPQFLLIEEPENGLNPFVIKELVNLFREKCSQGHFIWLNTHSQTLVSQLKEEEIILVDKKEGETQIKQFKGGDFQGLKGDEAWLTNVLGGGLPW